MIDLNDVQGLTIQLYPYRKARYLLFHCLQTGHCKGFLGQLSETLTTGVVPPDGVLPTLTNLALTATGLAAAGMTQADIAQFDPFFCSGPNPQLTGDEPHSPSGPSNWWEQQIAARQIDILVIIFARESSPLEERTNQVLEMAMESGLQELIPRHDGTRLNGEGLGKGRLHFGYKDGISQPDISWTDPISVNKVDYRNFLLGHSNEQVFSSPSKGPMAELATNSSYIVLRWLYQDVARFQLFLQTEGKLLADKLAISQFDGEELLAAKMLGRWRDGTPLELSPDGPSDLIPNNASFNYENDTKGQGCPSSSHVRVVNPRNQPLKPVAQTDGVPRVIRRGIPYGPEMSANQVSDDGIDRGLVGVFVCASILKQFYKLTQWISHNDFSPVFVNPHTQDPLFGNRAIADAIPEFSFPLKDGSLHRITGLPDFIRTKGTEFFLLPSSSMLRKLTA